MSGKIKGIIVGLAVILLLGTEPVTAVAAETPEGSRAIAAYTGDYSMGTVYSAKNGVGFKDITYASDYDTITVSATPNSGYSFNHFTDNGVIVTKSSYYSFNPGNYDHTVVAHFVERSDRKKDDDDDDDIGHVNWGNSACVYAPGYKINGMSITTSQVTQGKQCRDAFDSVRGDYAYIGMYNISFAHAGKPVEKLSGKVQLLFDIPAQYQKQGRQFAMLRVYKGQAEFLPDLGERGNKVQFETDCTAAYALVYRDPIPGVTDAAALAQQQALAGQQALAQQQALAAQQAALAGQQTQTITLTNDQIALLQQILAAAQANQK